MEIEKEIWDVAGWDVNIDYNLKQINMYFGDTKFYLNYQEEEKDCQIREFIDFLYKALSKIRRPEPVERKEMKP